MNKKPYTVQGLRLIQLVEEDAADIIALQDVIMAGLPDESWYYPSPREAFAQCCQRGECFGYYAGKRLAGFATLTPWHARPERCYAGKLGYPAENTYDVQDVMVHPEYRRRGIHSQLLALFEEIARTLKARALYATVAPDNLPSLAGFEKAGYARLATRPAYDGRMRAYLEKQL